MFEAILREIQSYDTIILHRHSRPDGDALGSQFGLKYILQASYPHKAIYAVGDDPGNYRCIGGGVMDEIPASACEGALASKKVALFGSYGWGDGEWMRNWEDRVTSSGGVLYGEGLMINETPDDDGLESCRELGRKMSA